MALELHSGNSVVSKNS